MKDEWEFSKEAREGRVTRREKTVCAPTGRREHVLHEKTDEQKENFGLGAFLQLG